ncbi:MAG: hypothetical protein IJH55_09185, partial [Romboutsia sp.]|nr:hypothetical protein [Romboutsia sp.]
YRVLAHYDVDTQDFPRNEVGEIDATFDDLYIPCRKGVITHTYDDFDQLVLCVYDKRPSVTKSIYEEIIKKYPDIDVQLVLSGNDGYIYFYDKDINKIASIVKPKTSGAKIKWSDNRNLPKIEYIIPEEDNKKLSNAIKKLSRTQKMQLMKSCNSEFLDKISTAKFDAKVECKKSRLSPKEYIHSLGIWDKYIRFIKKKIKED